MPPRYNSEQLRRFLTEAQVPKGCKLKNRPPSNPSFQAYGRRVLDIENFVRVIKDTGISGILNCRGLSPRQGGGSCGRCDV